MTYSVAPSDYAARAQALHKAGDTPSLLYAALELRCGIEARLQQHAAVAVGVSKSQATQWEIKKLARTLDQAFGLGDSILLVFMNMNDGRSCQFMYAPVSSRLQEVGKRCGDYLHALRPDRTSTKEFWTELRKLITEGCGLLDLACSSEILRPTVETGLHFDLRPDDARIEIVRDLIAGVPGKFTTATIFPTSPMTYYPADEA